MDTQSITRGNLGERRYDLDWVRIGAFMLLIFYHVGMYYVSWDWHVKSPSASHTIEPLMLLSSPWRLSLFSYFVILLVLFAVREFRVRRAGELRAQTLAAQLSEARLRHLTAQIEPHFLFNSLNAISNRMHEDIEAADRMISQLADLLRAAYESDDSVLVPLARELGWLHGYAAMMAERFRGHLAFEIEVDAGIEALQVPRLLLQPIVENAIRHGLTDGQGWLKVEVRCDGKRLEYTVSDDGAGFPDKPLVRGTGHPRPALRRGAVSSDRIWYS
jgi:sensor histidine kinase YesM